MQWHESLNGSDFFFHFSQNHAVRLNSSQGKNQEYDNLFMIPRKISELMEFNDYRLLLSFHSQNAINNRNFVINGEEKTSTSYILCKYLRKSSDLIYE